MRNILACIDASSYAASVCDLAAWAARKLEKPVELLHVVQRRDAVAERHDLSGAIGLGVKSTLMEELTQFEEAEASPGAILMMGAYGHSPLRTLIVGSTTTAMIRTVRVPVLLMR